MTCFILAGGFGTRLAHLTYRIPKPLIKTGNKKAIDYIISNLQFNGVFNILVNIHYMPLPIVEYLRDSVKYFASTKLMGTAGEVLKAKDYLFRKIMKVEDSFIVHNGDTITNVDIYKMLLSHNVSKAIVTIFTKDDAIHSGGIYIFRKEIFNYIPKNKVYFIHTDLIPKLIRKKIPINLYKSDAYYFDIGTPQGLKNARSYFKSKTN